MTIGRKFTLTSGGLALAMILAGGVSIYNSPSTHCCELDKCGGCLSATRRSPDPTVGKTGPGCPAAGFRRGNSQPA